MNVTNLALRNRLAVFVMILIVVIAGAHSYLILPKESSPDITIPYIVISTPYFGVSPNDIENLITSPIERELKGLSDVEEIRSTSMESYSSITVEYVAGTDIDAALQKVRDKVDLAKPDLPEDAEDPIVSEINFSDIPIMILNVSGPMGLVGLKKIAEDLEDEIETIPGVLQATVTGGLTREVQVNVDPERLRFYNLSITDMVDAIRNEHLDTPGGDIDIGDTKFLVRIPGEFTNPENMKNIVLEVNDGRPTYLRDVARVIYSFEDKTSISRLNGEETVSISIQKRSGENLLKIADRVKELIEQEKAKIPPGVDIVITGDQSTDIRDMVNDLQNNIISGLILVVLVLFLAMGVRNAFLVGIAIPLSMLLSFLVMRMMGMTMNMVVLFSLILAVGMLVDNAIVIVENIFRHHSEGLPLWEASKTGTQEVAMPVIASTVTTLCAFFPLLAWPGIMGEFMKFLPITLIITLASSLFVALVFNPVIASRYMKVKGPRKVIEANDAKLGPILRRYHRALKYAMKRPLLVFSLSFLSLVVIVVIFAEFNHGIEFFPETDPRNIIVDVNAPTGTSLEASDRYVREVEKFAGELPDVENCVANVGSQGTNMNFSFGGGETNKSRVMIDLLDKEDRTQNSFTTLETMRSLLADMTGTEIEVTREEEGPPTGPPVNIEISGDNYQILGELAQQIRQKIRGIEGLVDDKDDYDVGLPELRVKVDREKAKLLGLNTVDIAYTVRTAINGTEAAKYRVGEDEYDITVRFAEGQRNSIEDLRNINVFYEGEQIPLSNIADIETTSGAGSIQHKDLKRMVTVSAEVDGRNENQVIQDAKDAMKEFQMPTGYYYEFTGQDEEQRESQEFLTQSFVIVLLLIAFVLISQFNSLILPFIIIFSVLLSLVGVLVGLLVTFTPFGIIMTGLGVISLAGVVVNNAIVLIDYIQQLRIRGYKKEEAIVQAGLVRFRPVMLTAITTILGLIPLSTGCGIDFSVWPFQLQIGSESSQWWGPMGVAVIFGLAFATLLTLIVVPVMYKLLTGMAEKLGVVPAYKRKVEFEHKDDKHIGTGVVR